MSKSILTERSGEYEYRNHKGETWHIAESYDVLGLSQWHPDYKKSKQWYCKRISTNPDYVLTGKSLEKYQIT